MKFKGHLSNISENTLITAVNDEGGEVNVAFDSEGKDTIPNIMKRQKAAGQPWMLVVDQNCEYKVVSLSTFRSLIGVCSTDGEGSAREHAALQPRFYGGAMIVARSFARIHETNLKVSSIDHIWLSQCPACLRSMALQKQGILPLWFVDEADYSKISAMDEVETVGLAKILDGDLNAQVTLRVTKSSGETVDIPTKHTLSSDQVDWIAQGSALNSIRAKFAK